MRYWVLILCYMMIVLMYEWCSLVAQQTSAWLPGSVFLGSGVLHPGERGVTIGVLHRLEVSFSTSLRQLNWHYR